MFTDLRDGSARHSVQQASSAEREVFVRAMPILPAAVRRQMAAEAAAVLTGAMEALSLPAFVCDGAGSVLSVTPTAEALVRTGTALCLKSQRLCTDNPAETQALDDAIAAAAFADSGVANPRRRMIVVRGGRVEASPLVLEVVSLPRREIESEFAPRALVIARGTRAPNERRAAVVQAAYGLTAAETQIAMQVGAGETPQAIASARGVAVGTVRSQIKTICAKLGVSRQAELVARLNDL